MPQGHARLPVRIEQIVGLSILALVVVGGTVVLLPFVTAILWAAVLCFSTWPLYGRLQRACGRQRNLAAALMTVILAVFMVLPFVIVALTFADSVSALIESLKRLRTEGLPPPPEWLPRVPFAGSLLVSTWTDMADNKHKIAEVLLSILGQSKGWLLARGMGIGRGILQLSVSVLVAFFFYRDGESVVERISAVGRRALGDYSQRLLKVIGDTIRSVVYGVLGTALAQGLTATVGFLIAGVPSPFLLGLLTFFLSLIPGGPPLVWIPATIWLFCTGHAGWGLFMGLWGLVAISMIDNLLRPYLISRGTALPFVLVFLGAIGGLWVFGFIGIFLGPTLLSTGYALVQEFVKRGYLTDDVTADKSAGSSTPEDPMI